MNKVDVQLISAVEWVCRYPAGLFQMTKVNVQLFTTVKGIQISSKPFEGE
jgi:hypothetical protein